MNTASRSQFDIFLSLITVFSIVFLDQLTKKVFSNILSVGETLPILPNVLHMTLVHNTGIAFGLFKDQGIVFIIIPVITLILLIYNIYYYHQNNESLSSLYIVTFSMISGGAIGNLIDRLFYGYVIDFIDIRFWPVFNIADSAITIGALILMVKCLQYVRQK
ncbi:MAG: signal peptidase II [Candidatus Omnitrophica bacterium]|nr:signal peptidase II [Candidatus Omnitrophota bacterium]